MRSFDTVVQSLRPRRGYCGRCAWFFCEARTIKETDSGLLLIAGSEYAGGSGGLRSRPWPRRQRRVSADFRSARLAVCRRRRSCPAAGRSQVLRLEGAPSTLADLRTARRRFAIKAEAAQSRRAVSDILLLAYRTIQTFLLPRCCSKSRFSVTCPFIVTAVTS